MCFMCIRVGEVCFLLTTEWVNLRQTIQFWLYWPFLLRISKVESTIASMSFETLREGSLKSLKWREIDNSKAYGYLSDLQMVYFVFYESKYCYSFYFLVKSV